MPDRDPEDSAADKKSKGSPGTANQKSKDLSHVPCKFFKVGSCTAGSSCPFSHSAEPGAQKDVCAWFIKGNCKFGHKCALAHILPGQPMSMDRKNKKAAQLANSSSGGGGSGSNREKSKSGKREGGRSESSRSNSSSNPLLTGGSTAPKGLLGRGPSVLSKANLASPSAPAPPITVKGTEFVEQFAAEEALRDEQRKITTDPQEKEPIEQKPTPPKAEGSTPKPVQSSLTATSPRSTGSHSNLTSTAPLATSPSRVNGFSPGTSPSTNNPLGNGILSTSPFAVPSHSVFMSSTYAGEGLLSGRSGAPSSSLGAGKWGEDVSSPPRSKNFTSINAEYDATYNIHGNERRKIGPLDDIEDGDDGAEDFVPSSLTELLTPEEMKRRISRGNSHQSGVGPTRGSEGEDSIRAGINAMHLSAASGGQGHRYSRSVPSPSFLGDIRNIWAEPNVSSSPSRAAIGPGLPSSPGRLGFSNGFSGIPDSAGLTSAGSATSFGNHLSPSNASAAFLSSGLHQHYAQSRQGPITAGLGRGFSGQNRPSALDFSSNVPYTPSHGSQHLGGIQSSTGDTFPSQRPGLTNTQSSNLPREQATVGSPGSRVLQTHAPGQSLPQGLAAGYSRIHALPPLPVNSPNATRGMGGTPGSYVPGSSPLSSSFTNTSGFVSDGFDSIPGSTPTKGGMDPFSKFSYSQAARPSPNSGSASGISPFMPPQVSRTVSSARGPPNASSPLAVQGAPASAVGGDDDLFSMDDPES